MFRCDICYHRWLWFYLLRFLNTCVSFLLTKYTEVGAIVFVVRHDLLIEIKIKINTTERNTDINKVVV